MKELHEYASALSYEYLVRESCNELDIHDANVEPIRELEVYLIEDLFVRAAGQMNCTTAARLLDQSGSPSRFCIGIPADPSFRSSDDFGCSGTRSGVRFWRLPRSHHGARFFVSRCWRYATFRDLHRYDFDNSFSHRTARLPWSRCLVWVPGSGAGVPAHTSRCAPRDRYEG